MMIVSHNLEHHSRDVIYDHCGDHNLFIESSIVFIIVWSLTIVIYDRNMFTVRDTITLLCFVWIVQI
jgi:hypothetical protein